jgi:hypothetical protein
MKLILLVVIAIVVLVIAARVWPRPGALPGQPRTGAGGGRSARVQQLRRSLMSKAMGDASKVDAWVEYERNRAPLLSEEEYYVRANDRWERDNR